MGLTPRGMRAGAPGSCTTHDGCGSLGQWQRESHALTTPRGRRRPPVTPAASATGSTGRTHGETAVGGPGDRRRTRSAAAPRRRLPTDVADILRGPPNWNAPSVQLLNQARVFWRTGRRKESVRTTSWTLSLTTSGWHPAPATSKEPRHQPHRKQMCLLAATGALAVVTAFPVAAQAASQPTMKHHNMKHHHMKHHAMKHPK
jgi:hypothetical protein